MKRTMDKNIIITGISRSCEYSPNHIGNDAAIFNMVAEYLDEYAVTVRTYTETEFTAREINYKEAVCFSMARESATLRKLRLMEDRGARVINSAYGVSRCMRLFMTELFSSNGIPSPDTLVLPVDSADLHFLEYPCWIKRGDSHTKVKEDVCYVSSFMEAKSVFTDFKNRNIPVAVINRHVYGDLVKFYGVGNRFFRYFYPSHGKFGLETINGEARGIPFDIRELERICKQASTSFGVPVYGGDCVIKDDGSISMIDFNDWPSFARYRREAAKHIADYIYELACDYYSLNKE